MSRFGILDDDDYKEQYVSKSIDDEIDNKYFKSNKKKSKLLNLCQLIFEVGLLVVFVYLIRIFVKHVIPNPLKGIEGFDPTRVKELNGPIILAFAFLMYLKTPIQSKVDKLYNFF